MKISFDLLYFWMRVSQPRNRWPPPAPGDSNVGMACDPGRFQNLRQLPHHQYKGGESQD